MFSTKTLTSLPRVVFHSQRGVCHQLSPVVTSFVDMHAEGFVLEYDHQSRPQVYATLVRRHYFT